MKSFIAVLTVALMLCFSSIVMADVYNTFDRESRTSTAWSPYELHGILTQEIGVTFVDPSAAPSGYSDIKDGKRVFDKTPRAYSPQGYHKVFTAYGMTIAKDRIINLGWVDYCDLVNDRIIWSNGSYAYSPRLFLRIISIYDVMAPEPPPDTDGDGVTDDIDECPNTPYGAVVDDRGCWVLDGNTLFEFDSSVVREQFLPRLQAVANVFAYEQNANMTVILAGHTDSIGSVEYNQALSKRRAIAVGKILVGKYGVDIERIDVVGYGELDPIATNETTEGRQLNRRVELVPIY